MTEREYCFKVKDLEQSKKFCLDNGFQLVSETEQTRTIYRKSDKTMARITEDKINDKVKLSLDFKEDKLSGESLTVRKESKALVFESLDAVLSILDFLCYNKDNVLKRKRWIFEKDNIVCEIDFYHSEDGVVVVSIEGNNYEGVDEFYQKFLVSVENYEK